MVLWTVRRLDHEYQAVLHRLGSDTFELRMMRDGQETYVVSLSSEQAAVEESERYREVLVRSGPM